MRPIVSASSCLLVTAVLTLPAAPRDDFEDEVQRLAALALEDGAEGLALAVAFGPELALAEGWGHVEGPKKEPAEAGSSFRVGPLTTTFLAVAAWQLIEADELDPEAPLTEFFPGLPYGDGLTIRHLLAHTSGLPSYADALPSEGTEDMTLEPALILNWLKSGPLDSTPGTCLAYSPTDDLLLGLVLQQVAERPLREILGERVFARAGMEDTLYCFDGPELHGEAPAIQELGGHDVLLETPPPFGAAGLCSTVEDLVRFQRALVQHDLLSEETLGRMAAPAQLDDDTELTWAHGLGLSPLEDFECQSVGGAVAGYRVHLAYFPAADLTVAALSYGDEASLRRLVRGVAREALQLPDPEAEARELSADAHRRYVGEYFIGCWNYAVVSEGDHLVAQFPGGEHHRLRYRGDNVFVSEKDPEIRLTFFLTDDLALGFLLEAHGTRSRASRLT